MKRTKSPESYKAPYRYLKKRTRPRSTRYLCFDLVGYKKSKSVFYFFGKVSTDILARSKNVVLINPDGFSILNKHKTSHSEVIPWSVLWMRSLSNNIGYCTLFSWHDIFDILVRNTYRIGSTNSL
jgi:hypothetical protein